MNACDNYQAPSPNPYKIPHATDKDGTYVWACDQVIVWQNSLFTPRNWINMYVLGKKRKCSKARYGHMRKPEPLKAVHFNGSDQRKNYKQLWQVMNKEDMQKWESRSVPINENTSAGDFGFSSSWTLHLKHYSERIEEVSYQGVASRCVSECVCVNLGSK